jgi:hypothetical protein
MSQIAKPQRITNKAAHRAKWISDTQLFQRINGVEESSEAELGAAYDAMKTKRRISAGENADTHLTIARLAREAGKNRQN